MPSTTTAPPPRLHDHTAIRDAHLADALARAVDEAIDPPNLTEAETAQLIPRLHERFANAGDVPASCPVGASDGVRHPERRHTDGWPAPTSWPPLTA